ncbi:fumarylacetoacetate hydrolase family protein [Sphingomonas sp.]|uniref:fumarylacetoacetate hydrolase family protein n=1 Tax=Sphingomonas sp. TaxID=28214 RepID=UPI002D804AFD|nr:fumarylacetoacetate hydrolase family protein [Sphingomonas sp.]HEU0045411.1 fumarylacetoacetate hydrolase family protein [Sphingomonas sp.]
MTEFAPETGLATGSFGFGTYRSRGGASFPGLVMPDGAVFDLSDRYRDTHAILDDWDRALDAMADVAARGGTAPYRFAELEALPPLAHPNLLCAGANYRQHVAEMMTHNKFNQHNRHPGESDEAFFARNLEEVKDRALNGIPYFWTGLHSSLVGADADLVKPLIGAQLDWELEFGAIVARGDRYVRPEDANDLVAGYVMVNDIGTVDEFRRIDVRWGFDWISKHQPSFKPAGPFIVPKQFVKLDEVRIHLAVNGETKQDWPISDMIFSVEQLLSYASERVRLLPGDQLITGSPPGNGALFGQFLEPGDVIDSSITFLGRQRNRVVAEETGGRVPTFGAFKTA